MPVDDADGELAVEQLEPPSFLILHEDPKVVLGAQDGSRGPSAQRVQGLKAPRAQGPKTPLALGSLEPLGPWRLCALGFWGLQIKFDRLGSS